MINVRNVVILFAPGLGGNHLANMLSTSAEFESRCSVSDYLQSRSQDAHFSPAKNLQIATLGDKLSSPGHIVCGHWAEYYWLQLTCGIESNVHDQLLVIKLPSASSLAWQRFFKYSSLSSTYLIEEQRSLYSIEIIGRLFTNKDIFEVESDRLFDPDINWLIEFAAKDMGIQLDRDQCRHMHQIWHARLTGDQKGCA